MAVVVATYFFCDDPSRDPVASRVYAAIRRRSELSPVGVSVDNRPVESVSLPDGELRLVRTDDVLSHDYGRYLPMMNDVGGDSDFAVAVNWHEGMNAPDRVLTVHTTGDVPARVWGQTDPSVMRNLLVSLERARNEAMLADYSVVSEATHWSGVPYGGDPRLISDFEVPIFDVEIGSSEASWADERAVDVLAVGLLSAVREPIRRGPSYLCAGGVHIETSFSDAVLATARDDSGISISHVLPNQWLVSGEYDRPGTVDDLKRCVESIAGGVSGIVIHDKLKATYKEPFRALGDELGVPVMKHTRLRTLDGLSR